MNQSKVTTVSDLHAEVRRLRSELQRMKPAPETSGHDFVKRLGKEDPRQRFQDALDADKNSQRSEGMQRAQQLLAEQGDMYPHDGNGTRMLADHAGIGMDDARNVFSEHLRKLDEERGRHEDAERTHLLGRAKQFAPGFLRTAVLHGLDTAAQKLATKAQVSISIAREAIEQHANGLDDDQPNS